MSTRVLTATAETRIREIARVFVEERVGCLPILSPEKELIGILTTTDILGCLLNVAPLDLWT
jgi:CBS domain-containing protein